MWDFFIKTFIKNPVGLIVLGILVGMFGGEVAWAIGGIISAIGIVWLVMRKRSERKAIAAHLPFYLEIVDALKNSGYEVSEFEHKRDRVRSSVRLNGKHLGEVFLVAPPPSGRYAQFRRIEDMTRKDFEHDYSRKFGKSPGISSSYWPDNSLIGASIEESAENYQEKGEWLSNVANIFQEKSSQK
jgi:hypothetical protein